MVRDGAAFGELSAALVSAGFEYGGLLFNYPKAAMPDGVEGTYDFTSVGPTDLIVITTRPPMEKGETPRIKRLFRSHSELEDAVFKEFEKVFEACSRSYVKMRRDYIDLGDGMLAEMEFRQHTTGQLTKSKRETYQRMKAVVEPPIRGIGFLLQVPHLERFECGLLVSFGMGGLETLIWNRIIRTRHPQWLQTHHFVMAEMDLTNVPFYAVAPKRGRNKVATQKSTPSHVALPSDLHFVDSVPVSVLGEMTLASMK